MGLKFLEKIKRLVSKKKKEEIIELPETKEEEKKVMVRIEKLGGLADVRRIENLVKKGNIVFLRTLELQRKDLGQFQTSVQKLKRICEQYGWDIAGTEEGYIIVTPRSVRIVRKKVSK